MIFLTVGTQLSFDRLVRAVDRWAGQDSSRVVHAQTAKSDFVPQHLKATPFMSPQECRRLMEQAGVIVAHAGMGTIIAALEMGKPLLIMPRRADLGEQRNDHQLATARYFGDRGVAVAWDEHELSKWLDQLDAVSAPTTIKPHAPEPMIDAIRRFINGEDLNASVMTAGREVVP